MTGLKKLLSFGKSSKKPPAPNPEHSAESSGDVVQKIDVTGIDPEKLMAKLKLKFGSEFEIYVGRLLESGEVEVR